MTPKDTTALTFAVPKGRILDEALPVMARAGVVPADAFHDKANRSLTFATTRDDMRLIRVRAFDVATFVAHGAAQMGIVGSDVIEEFDYAELYAPVDLDIGHCRLSVAEPGDARATNGASHLRVATKYPGLTRRHFERQGIQAECVKLNGAMEIAPELGLAGRIVDLVSTGHDLARERAGRNRSHYGHHRAPDRQPDGAEDRSARGCTGRGLPRQRRRAQRRLMQLLRTSDADFETQFERVVRARRETDAQVGRDVAAIINEVRERGDKALVEYTTRFDQHNLSSDEDWSISKEACEAAYNSLDAPLREALETAAARIRAYHEGQMPQDRDYTDEIGMRLGARWGAVEAAGLYVPGGRAAYPSSLLMNAIPAKVAGVDRLVVTTPTPGGEANDLVLAAAHIAGVDEIWRVGGAQAVAALAYGTDRIARVDVVTGPGNAWVAEAKRQLYGVVGIDMVAGPSEILVIADATTIPNGSRPTCSARPSMIRPASRSSLRTTAPSPAR